MIAHGKERHQEDDFQALGENPQTPRPSECMGTPTPWGATTGTRQRMTLRAHALLGVYGYGAPKQEPRLAPLSRKQFIS